MPLPNPVIFVPGITATNLRDLYPMPPETIWSLLNNDYDRVRLHPEDQRYEALLPAQVRADELYEIAYREMILDLRHDLSPTADKPVPVYTFGYDWRQPLEAVQVQLGAFIDEVIEKTCLTRHYRADGYPDRPRVNLVGHSMGGLVVTGYLAGAVRPRVERIATIATPYRGSLDAVAKLTTGTANRREREASRLTPSLYYLLPSFEQGIEIDPKLPQTDLFDPKLWQQSILDSIQEAIRLYGSGAINPTQTAAQALLERMLQQAKAHRQMVESFNPADAGIAEGDWACFIGVGDMTRVGLRITASPIGPVFDVTSKDLFDDVKTQPTWRTGDGTVPFSGATPPFESEVKLFSGADFGLLELKEKALDAFAALHGIICNMDKLQSALRNHLTKAAA